jgi:RNA polymerase sigma-70 factor, ECF subfamily
MNRDNSEAADCPIEQEDFERIVPQYQKQIYRILLCHVRDADAADTLTQECFLRAYKKRSSFRGESSVGTWLIKIAINLARDHNRSQHLLFWRRLARTDQIDKIPAAYWGPSPEKALQDREIFNAILAETERLSKKQKTIFLLHFVEGMTLDEIAATIGLELGTVKSHLSRALESVRRGCKRRQREKSLPVCEREVGAPIVPVSTKGEVQ